MVFNFQEHFDKILNLCFYKSDGFYKVFDRNNHSSQIQNIVSNCYLKKFTNIESNVISGKLLNDLKYSNKVATPQLILLLLTLTDDSYNGYYYIISKNNNIYALRNTDYIYILYNLLDTDDDIIIIPNNDGHFNLKYFIRSITKDKLSDYEYDHYLLDRQKFRFNNMFKNDILYILYYKYLMNIYNENKDSVLSKFLSRPYTCPFDIPNSLCFHKHQGKYAPNSYLNNTKIVAKEKFIENLQNINQSNYISEN